MQEIRGRIREEDTRQKGVPEVVILRMSMESQSESEIAKERSGVDGAVERIIAFITDKHSRGARGRMGTVGMGGGIVGTVGSVSRRGHEPARPCSSGPPDLRLLCFELYQ